MSAATYKSKLKETEEKLFQYQQAAQEWQEVAEDRLAMLAACGMITEVSLKAMSTRSEVCGVTFPSFAAGDVWDNRDEPELIAESLVSNLGALTGYCSSLQSEALDVTTLLDASLASVKVLSPVSRPTNQASRQKILERAKDIVDGIVHEAPRLKAIRRESAVMQVPDKLKRLPAKRLPTPSGTTSGTDMFS